MGSPSASESFGAAPEPLEGTSRAALRRARRGARRAPRRAAIGRRSFLTAERTLEELAEAGAKLDYAIEPVDIGKGDQFAPAYLAISPNNKMPAIVDHAPADSGAPISVFESGAILLYLANRTGRFFGESVRRKVEVNQWLMWQMGGLGPMTGQYGHFSVYAPEPIPYAIDRYTREVQRLLGVLDRRLAGRAFVAGDAYTIADMAAYPWINPYDKAPLDLSPFRSDDW